MRLSESAGKSLGWFCRFESDHVEKSRYPYIHHPSNFLGHLAIKIGAIISIYQVFTIRCISVNPPGNPRGDFADSVRIMSKNQDIHMNMVIEIVSWGGGYQLYLAPFVSEWSDGPEILTLWRGVVYLAKKSKIKWIGCLSMENEPPTFGGTSIWTDFNGFPIVFLYRKTMGNQSNRGPPKCRRLVFHAQTSDSLNFWFFGKVYHSSP